MARLLTFKIQFFKLQDLERIIFTAGGMTFEYYAIISPKPEVFSESSIVMGNKLYTTTYEPIHLWRGDTFSFTWQCELFPITIAVIKEDK